MTTHDDPTDQLVPFADLLDTGGDDPPPVDRRVRRRRRWIVAIVLLVLVALPLAAGGGYTVWALNAPLPSPVMTAEQPSVSTPGAVGIAMPTEGASALSVSGGEAYLGAGASGIWTSSGGDEARPLASISKLITALVVLDASPLSGPDDPGPTITFSKTDHDLYDEYYVQGATILAMPTGSSMSLRDALTAMLLPSASNYADAVSTWAFGSRSGFLAAARTWLDAHGMMGTTIVEPTGISARNTGTPGDLITLGKLAASEPTIAAIAAMPSAPLGDLGTVSNTNNLLGVDGITGLKTGNLGPDNYNLLYTSTLDVGIGEPLHITGVVLGVYSRSTVDSVVRAQLQSIRDGFHAVQLAEQGQQIGSLSTRWGSRAALVVASAPSILTWSDTPITVAMDVSEPATYTDGEVVGTITWTAGPNSTTADVVVSGGIEPPTEWWRLTHPGQLGGD
ncbi:D-alanyl-D-alanine carboxypeptidase [Microbacterium sp. BG28]|uniref:D-alanyl-D-alanine carboxypeptidase family protein n=1 Tax=Microbacterium sp. BG28 TaxID=3097356 RepID=UPI002A5A0B5A|nr:serine hydrolase [Microbacterium sp. BG28]MDY0827758.1 D-alanyl-D-alanine carboxypeptidase [Microbacterium sp. BG28]